MNIRIQTYGKLELSSPGRASSSPTYQCVWPSHPVLTSLLTCSPKENTTVFEALEKGLDDLMEACDVVTEKFTEARDAFGEDNMKS